MEIMQFEDLDIYWFQAKIHPWPPLGWRNTYREKVPNWIGSGLKWRGDTDAKYDRESFG